MLSTLVLTITLTGNEIREKARLIANGEHELTLQELDEILSSTIIEDYTTKTILFLTWLLTYTEKYQVNLILKGESSIGKTYNANEVRWYFPEEDILSFAKASPTSFIHKDSAILIDTRTMEPIKFNEKPLPKDKGGTNEEWEEWFDKQKHSAFYLDYSNKIIVFPDAPDSRLLQNLRPILSHDQKQCKYLVTTKRKGAHRTKEVIINGFFTCTFCTTSSKLDAQEISRHFMLSPNDNPEKIQQAIDLIARKNSDVAYADWYERSPLRLALKHRVKKIKEEITDHIIDIYIPPDFMEELKLWFLEKTSTISPKTQRDFPRLIALAQAFAVLNWKHRDIRPKTKTILYCNKKDIEAARIVYGTILKCNELGLTPEEYSIWQFFEPKAIDGLTIQNAHNLYFQRKKRQIADNRLRGMLKTFCHAGLFRQEKDGREYKYYQIHDGIDGLDIESTDKQSLILRFIAENKPHMEQILSHFKNMIPEKDIQKITTQLQNNGIIYKPDMVHYHKL